MTCPQPKGLHTTACWVSTQGKKTVRGTRDARCSITPFLSAQGTASHGWSGSANPTLPCWTPPSISNAGVTAVAALLLGAPDCNLKYQAKATLAAEILLCRVTRVLPRMLTREAPGTLVSATRQRGLQGGQRIREYPELERTHKDYRVQLLAPHSSTQKFKGNSLEGCETYRAVRSGRELAHHTI